MSYGEEWRITRRSFHSQFHGPVIQKYRVIQLQETRLLCARIFDTPDQARQHVQR